MCPPISSSSNLLFPLDSLDALDIVEWLHLAPATVIETVQQLFLELYNIPLYFCIKLPIVWYWWTTMKTEKRNPDALCYECLWRVVRSHSAMIENREWTINVLEDRKKFAHYVVFTKCIIVKEVNLLLPPLCFMWPIRSVAEERIYLRELSLFKVLTNYITMSVKATFNGNGGWWLWKVSVVV